MKIIFSFAFILIFSKMPFSQESRSFSKLPCNYSEVWQITEEYKDNEIWEEVILCDLNPKDPSTWTWYYNYKTNKKGLLKLNVISQWQDDNKSMHVLVKIPNNPNKYKISQIERTKNLRMEKVEGNMEKPYYKEFYKVQ